MSAALAPSTVGAPPLLTRAAWPVAAAAGLLTVVALVLYARNAAALGRPDQLYLADVWLGLVLPVLGAVVLRRGGAPLLGLVLLSGALLALTDAVGQLAIYQLHVVAAHNTVADLAAWVSAWAWTPYLLVPTLVVLLFPAGNLPSRGSRVLALGVAIVVATATLAWALAPVAIEGFPGLTNPWGIPGASWLGGVAGALTGITMVVLAPLCFVSVGVRAYRSRGRERTRLLWFLGACALALVALLAADGLPYPWPDIVAAVGLTMVLLVVAVTSRSLAITAGLAHSREELVRAREQERLRLHRDLHDGLGPELAGLALSVAAAARTVEDPDLRGQLGDAHERLHGLTREVRRLVDGLRPPSLDELGLAGALSAHAEAMTPTLQASIHSSGDLTSLPAAVEVAAFRIAGEALTNVVRHSGARSCEVRLNAGPDTLAVLVRDDGHWSAPTAGRIGAGCASMRARAEELGGSCVVAGSPGGTEVRAWLPLAIPS